MSRLQERETLALSSLRDISDYSTYIDDRITRLNHLYQSLNLQPQHHQPNKKPLLSTTIQQTNHYLQHRPSSNSKLYRNLNNQLHRTFCNNQVKLSGRKQMGQTIDNQMYRTEYYPKVNRYPSLDNHQEPKLITMSNFKNTIRSSRDKSSGRQQKERVPFDKLQLYKQVKNDILGTFYIGGRTLSHNRESINYNQLEQQMKGRRGKLWHGRPPVKIIQKYD